MATNVLFIFEGKKTEDTIVNSLKKHVLNNKLIITCAFDAEIYQLHRKIQEDRDLDTFSLVRERDEKLKGYKRYDFAEIYLFFDYDAHATSADDENIKDMLSLFDNETEEGKLYISYPMVESLRHISDYDSFKELKVKCKRANCQYMDNCNDKDGCVKEPKYKTVVATECIPQLNNINGYTCFTWKNLIDAHLSKMNNLVNGRYEFPEKIESQQTIFSKQFDKHINKRCPEVAVLSAFPVFIHDYYGNKKTKELCGK
jgi:hypothetical protein